MISKTVKIQPTFEYTILTKTGYSSVRVSNDFEEEIEVTFEIEDNKLYISVKLLS